MSQGLKLAEIIDFDALQCFVKMTREGVDWEKWLEESAKQSRRIEKALKEFERSKNSNERN